MNQATSYEKDLELLESSVYGDEVTTRPPAAMECKAKHSTAFLCFLRLSSAASMLLRGLLAQIPALSCFAMASYHLKYLSTVLWEHHFHALNFFHFISNRAPQPFEFEKLSSPLP